MPTFYDEDGNALSDREVLSEMDDWDIQREYDARDLGIPDNSDTYDNILFELHEAHVELMKELHNSDKTHFNVLIGKMEKLFDEYRSIN